MGGIYYVIPRILEVYIFSRRLANVQYAMYVIGFTFFFAGFLLVGAVQGTSWLHEGLPVWTVLPGLRPYMALRAAGGSVLWMSFLLFAYNVFATVIVRKPYHSPVISSYAICEKTNKSID